MLAFPQPLIQATFLRRENRFRAAVALADGREVAAHVPNSGRLGELLRPGTPCYVTSASAPGKTTHVLRLVSYAGVLVSVDARLPGPLFADAWARGALCEPFRRYNALVREVTRGNSRLDFRLDGPGGARCWVETKSVTLVGDATTGLPAGIAFFPDAPTQRGVKHLHALMAARAAGDEAAVVFIIQRPDAHAFAPHPTADPAFAEALRQVTAGGVKVYAFRCAVSLEGIEVVGEVEVL